MELTVTNRLRAWPRTLSENESQTKFELSEMVVRRNLMRASRKAKVEFSESDFLESKMRNWIVMERHWFCMKFWRYISSIKYRDIVQLVERWSPKPNVEGSSPSVPVADTEKQKCFSVFFICYSLLIICIQILIMLAWGNIWIHNDEGSAFLWAKVVA